MPRLMLPLIALVMAVATAFMARGWIEGNRAEAPAVAQPAPEVAVLEVLVARTDLDPGTLITEDSIRWQVWPDVEVPESYFAQDAAEIDPQTYVGAVVRSPIPAGAPVTRGGIIFPGDRGFLAAVIAEGMRGISIPIDETSSHAGLVTPGDHVDVILSQTLRDSEGESDDKRVSETVLANVRVIAIGRRLAPGTLEEGSSQVRTATLEVTPAEAEQVALVTELGRLSLSLRSVLADRAATAAPDEPEMPTWDHDVSQAIPANDQKNPVRIFRGGGTDQAEP